MATIGWLAVLAGMVFRLLLFLQRRPLWLDESVVMINLGSRSFGGLLAPLDFSQVAPILWLWLEKVVVMGLGVSEISLRLVPLLSGLALAPMTWGLTTRIAGRRAGIIAGVLVAGSAALIRFSAVEAKPYSSDALVTVLLLWLVLPSWREANTRRHWWLLGAAGVMAILASLPAPIVLAGMGLALGLDAVESRSWRRLIPIVAVSTVWLVVFLPTLRLNGPTGFGSFMQTYWHEAMGNLGTPGLLQRGKMLVRAITGVPYPIVGWWSALVGIFAVSGIDAMRRRAGWPMASALGLPIVITCGFWALDLLPASLRVLLFLAPLVAMLVAIGLDHGLCRLPPGLQRWTIPVAVAVVVLGAGRAIQPAHRTGNPALMQELAAQPDASIWISAWGTPTWLAYTTDWSAPDAERVDAIVAGRGRHDPWHWNEAITIVRPGGRRELYGTFDGIRTGFVHDSRTSPIPEWVATEVARIEVLATSGVWLLFLDDPAGTPSALVAALRDRGLRVVSVETGSDALLFGVGPVPPVRQR